MYYLLKADATVHWTDISEYTIDLLVKNNGMVVDYNRFDWQPAERRFDAGILNLALRYGHPAETGIVVAMRDLVELDTYRTMTELVKTVSQQPDYSATPGAGLMEALAPGWIESGRELDQQIVEDTKKAAEEAEREMLEAFDKPINPDLAQHWQNLGGPMPPQRKA